MSQLIALIIAIALGAIVTAIGYVFLGDAFTKNSEKGMALQFINQGEQVAMTMVAYRAENAKTAFDSSWINTEAELVSKGYLKDGLIPPVGVYYMSELSSTLPPVMLHVDTGFNKTKGSLSAEVCEQIEKVAGRSLPLTSLTANNTAAMYTAIQGKRFGCFVSFFDSNEHVFIYSAE